MTASAKNSFLQRRLDTSLCPHRILRFSYHFLIFKDLFKSSLTQSPTKTVNYQDCSSCASASYNRTNSFLLKVCEMNRKTRNSKLFFCTVLGIVRKPLLITSWANYQQSDWLTLQCLMSTKRSHILKQTCTFQLQGFFGYVCPFSGHQALTR